MPSKNKLPAHEQGPESEIEEAYVSDRRHFLVVATGVIAAIGAAVAALPFVESLRPSQRARAQGGPVTVDLSRIPLGVQKTVMWRGKPIWILHRTQAEIDALSTQILRSELRDPDSNASIQPVYTRNGLRSTQPEFFVCIASCTHLGCVPLLCPGVEENLAAGMPSTGYYCPCHGSKFDLAGRVFKDVPAPTNLSIPPHHYTSDSQLVIGASA